MIVTDQLYHEFQPVSWAVGVVNAPAKDVASAIATHDPRAVRSAPAALDDGSIRVALGALEPLGAPGKLMVAATADGRAALFSNLVAFPTVTEYATLSAAHSCRTRAYFLLRIPNTISPDGRSGSWGARKLVMWDSARPDTEAEPTFVVSVINDNGRWEFERLGPLQQFEEPERYRERRIAERFSEESLLLYCERLRLGCWDETWYLNQTWLVRMQSISGDRGMSYREAAKRFGASRPSSESC